VKHLPDAVRAAAERSLDELSVAEERAQPGDDFVVCQKIIPNRDGLKAALLLVGSEQRVRAAFAALMYDESEEE
jgi:hypothetical protein